MADDKKKDTKPEEEEVKADSRARRFFEGRSGEDLGAGRPGRFYKYAGWGAIKSVLSFPGKILKFFTTGAMGWVMLFLLIGVIFFAWQGGIYEASIKPVVDNTIGPALARVGNTLFGLGTDPLGTVADIGSFRDPDVVELKPKKGVGFQDVEAEGPYFLGQDIVVNGRLKIDPLADPLERNEVTLVCVMEVEDRKLAFGEVTVFGGGAEIITGAAVSDTDKKKKGLRNKVCGENNQPIYEAADNYAVISVRGDVRERPVYKSFRCKFPGIKDINAIAGVSSNLLGGLNKDAGKVTKPTIAVPIKLFAIYKDFRQVTNYEVYALDESSLNIGDDYDLRVERILKTIEESPDGSCISGCGLAKVNIFSREPQPFYLSEGDRPYQYRLLVTVNIPLETKGRIAALKSITIQRAPYMSFVEGDGAFNGKNYLGERAIQDFNTKICDKSTFSHYDFDAIFEVENAPVLDLDNDASQIPHQTMVVETVFDWEASYSTSAFVKNTEKVVN